MSVIETLIASYDVANANQQVRFDAPEHGYRSAQGQTFKTPTIGSYKLTRVQFQLWKFGNPLTNIYARLYAHNGQFGSTGVPTGLPLAISNPASTEIIGEVPSLITFTFSGLNQCLLSPDIPYCIVVGFAEGDLSTDVKGIQVGIDLTGTHEGNLFVNSNDVWSYYSEPYDAVFYVYGEPTITRQLTILIATGGTTNPLPGNYLVAQNAIVAVQAIPNVDYQFDYWLLDGINVGSLNPYPLTMDTDHMVLAVFAEIPAPVTHTLTVDSTPIQGVPFTIERVS